MMLDMMIGMAMGMVASPLMMKGVKVLRQRRKIDRLFHEIAETRSSMRSDSMTSNSEMF